MLKEFSRVGPVTAWTLIGVAGNALAGVVVARSLVPNDRGLVAITLSTAGLIGVASTLGSNAAFRAKFPQRSGVNMPGFAALTGILLLALCGPALIAGGIITGHLVDERLAAPAGLVAFAMYGSINFVWFQSREALNASGDIAFGAMISAIGSLALCAAVSILALSVGMGPFAVVACYVLSVVLQMLCAFYRLRRHWHTFRPKGVVDLLRTGPKMLGFHFGQDLVFQADRYILGVLAGTTSVGFYAVAATPAELLRIPPRSSGQYVLLDAARGTLNARDLRSRTLTWVVVIAASVPILWLLAPVLIQLVYGVDYMGAVAPFRYLLIAQVMLVPYLIYSRAVVGLGATWSSSLSGVVGLLALIGASYLLVPNHGSTGAALAAACAYLAMSLTAVGVLLRRVSRRAS